MTCTTRTAKITGFRSTSQSLNNQPETPIDSFATSQIGVIKQDEFEEEAEDTSIVVPRQNIRPVLQRPSSNINHSTDSSIKKERNPRTQIKLKVEPVVEPNHEHVDQIRKQLEEEKRKREEERKKRDLKEIQNAKEKQEQQRKLKDNDKKHLAIDADGNVLALKGVNSHGLIADFVMPNCEFKRMDKDQIDKLAEKERDKGKEEEKKKLFPAKKANQLISKQDTLKAPKEKKEASVIIVETKEKQYKPVGSNFE